MSIDLIPRRKLSHDVLERLKLRITGGEFPPGAQLPSERDLMAQYGVGRPAIREAFQQLEHAGMIVIQHGARANVAVPNAESLLGQMRDSVQFLLHIAPETSSHLREARVVMETGLARLAAKRADKQGVERLRVCYDAHRKAGLTDFLSHDIAFHRQIAIMGQNPIFPPMIEGILGWLAVHHHDLVRAPGAEAITLAEHAAIIEAIAAHDADGAAQAMADHLTRANALYAQGARPSSSFMPLAPSASTPS